MKFQEHRIGTGKYFVYGMPSKKINEIISQIKDNPNINKLGIHIHRKSQNTSEWEIQEELEDSLTKESLERINTLNLGGGLPVKYRSYNDNSKEYIFQKLTNTKNFLDQHNIQTIIEPGRFLAAPCIKLETEIIQVQEKNLIINTTIYNCALDNILTGTKMLVEKEIPENQNGQHYLIKGNSPCRDDIFRYKVKLQNPKVGDKIIFLNAGAYNYTTDFFGYKKLETKITD
jgi:ornithine decarboxylase